MQRRFPVYIFVVCRCGGFQQQLHHIISAALNCEMQRSLLPLSLTCSVSAMASSNNQTCIAAPALAAAHKGVTPSKSSWFGSTGNCNIASTVISLFCAAAKFNSDVTTEVQLPLLLRPRACNELKLLLRHRAVRKNTHAGEVRLLPSDHVQ